MDNRGALGYLLSIDLTKWTLKEGGNVRWGNLTTNISESYNNALKGTRFLPIRALVDATLKKMVKIYREEYVKSRQCKTPLPPILWPTYVAMDRRAARHTVDAYDSSGQMFKVRTHVRTSGKGGNDHVVAYRQRSCTCGKWQEYRYPCSHGLSVVRHLGHDVRNVVDRYLTVRNWTRQFDADGFYPVPPVGDWRDVGWELEPDYTRLVLHTGRKKKNRFRGQMDYTRRRSNNSSQAGQLDVDISAHVGNPCTNCGVYTHNAYSCPRMHPGNDRLRVTDEIIYDGEED